jgi:hypothetical protein
LETHSFNQGRVEKWPPARHAISSPQTTNHNP